MLAYVSTSYFVRGIWRYRVNRNPNMRDGHVVDFLILEHRDSMRTLRTNHKLEMNIKKFKQDKAQILEDLDTLLDKCHLYWESLGAFQMDNHAAHNCIKKLEALLRQRG